jgi:nucleobase:cation symporter-1, NCS1 family
MSQFESAGASAAPPGGATDVAGRVEVRGIDVVPLEERHGHPRELFWLWLAANTSFIYVILGGLMILIGLNIWQAILAVVIGNAFYLLIGIMGTPGPKAGTSTLIISRAQYGIHGNRFSAFLSWFNLVAFEAINFSIGAFALFALADFAGWDIGNGGKALLLALVIIVTFVVAFLGHATIVVFQKAFAYALVVLAIALFIFVLPDVDWSYQPETPLSGGALLALWLLGLTIIMSGPLSWCGNPADFTRYFRPDTPPGAMTLWATVGCFLPAVFLSIIAVLAGTAVDMTDPATSMKTLMPNWFYPLFLLVIAFGTTCNNILGVYSSGLSLQSVGVRIPRWGAVLVDAIIGSSMTVYAVFISDFLTTLTEFLQFMVWWYAGFSAIFVVDLLLRRREYDGVELHRRGGRYWYDRGFNWRGLVALALAIVTAGAFANTTHWQSPIVTNYLEGADISALVGLVVGATSYWLLMRRRIGVPAAEPATASAPAPSAR